MKSVLVLLCILSAVWANEKSLQGIPDVIHDDFPGDNGFSDLKGDLSEVVEGASNAGSNEVEASDILGELQLEDDANDDEGSTGGTDMDDQSIKSVAHEGGTGGTVADQEVQSITDGTGGTFSDQTMQRLAADDETGRAVKHRRLIRSVDGDGIDNLVSHVLVLNDAPVECSSYTILNEANRQASYLDKKVALCDNSMTTKWYRFSDAAGKSIPDSCVDQYRCGTHAPGWLNGKHPTVAEGAVSREVCYHWSNKCCNWKNNIRVRNCGGFYVYELRKPPVCHLRYCGGGPAPADACADKPCQNGGTCTRVANGYSCSCSLGFTGNNCDKDACADKPCQNGGTCTRVANGYSCSCSPGFTGNNCDKDVDECKLDNGRCSHKCTNTAGGFKCECPDPELSLAEDQRTCKASGVIIGCRKTEMAITLPKALLRGMNRDHLRLNDPSCLATETATHYTLTTPLNGCGTTARLTKDSIVYTNRLMEIPVVAEQVVTRIRDIEIPFSCYYSKVGVASVVQMHMSSRKLVVSESQRANFTIALEVFPDASYSSKFSEDDFPVSVAVRKRIYFQLSVETNDKRLSTLAEECFATPTQDPNNAIQYEIIKSACPVDDTVKFEKAPSVQLQRFSLEAFKFIGDNPFAFFHCRERICNASDPNSRCAKGCQQGKRRRRDTDDSHDVYNLAQGPFVRTQQEDMKESVTNIPLVIAVAAVGVLCIMGISYIVVQRARLGVSTHNRVMMSIPS